MRRIVYILALTTMMLGCGGSSGNGRSAADAEAAAAGLPTENQIRYYIAEDLKLESLKLVPAENGNFTATGKAARGVSYDIEITRTPGTLEYTWKDARGKTGSGGFSTAGK